MSRISGGILKKTQADCRLVGIGLEGLFLRLGRSLSDLRYSLVVFPGVYHSGGDSLHIPMVIVR